MNSTSGWASRGSGRRHPLVRQLPQQENRSRAGSPVTVPGGLVQEEGDACSPDSTPDRKSSGAGKTKQATKVAAPTGLVRLPLLPMVMPLSSLGKFLCLAANCSGCATIASNISQGCVLQKVFGIHTT